MLPKIKFSAQGDPYITFINVPRSIYNPFVMAKCGEYGESEMGGEIIPLVINNPAKKAETIVDYNLL